MTSVWESAGTGGSLSLLVGSTLDWAASSAGWDMLDEVDGCIHTAVMLRVRGRLHSGCDLAVYDTHTMPGRLLRERVPVIKMSSRFEIKSIEMTNFERMGEESNSGRQSGFSQFCSYVTNHQPGLLHRHPPGLNFRHATMHSLD